MVLLILTLYGEMKLMYLQELTNIIHSMCVYEVSIISSEQQMYKNYQLQFQNWTTPIAYLRIFSLFNDENFLNQHSYKVPIKLMFGNIIRKGKIEEISPDGNTVAHKTVSFGINKEGKIATSNDVGITTLPNNRKFVIAVFISKTEENGKMTDNIIV